MKLIQYLEKKGIEFKKTKDNLTVGGSLDLRETQIKELPDKSKYKNQQINLLNWKEGKYIMVDNMFCEVIMKRCNVWKCKKIGKNNEFYVVSDGKGKFAHGDSVKEAKKDLIYKISNRDKREFESLSLKSKLPFEKMVECYRVVTGACGFGVKEFVESKGITKKKYSIEEIIKLTENSYGGNCFAKFFNS